MKTLRKNLLNAIGIASLLALAGLLSSACAGPFEPAPEPGAPEGYVRITIAPDALARTMLPNALQLYFTLAFNDGSATTTETLGGALQKTVALIPGAYTLAVLGYTSPYEAENGGTPVVNGSASFPVGAGTNPDVDVDLTAAQSGTGTLRYTLTYPTNPAVSGGRIHVEELGGSYTKLIIPVISNSYDNTTGTLPDLASGYYQVTAYLSNGRTAIKSDLAHIYDGLETDANFVFDLSSFADVADLSPLNAAIAAAKAAASADLRISPDGAGITAGHTWVSQADMDALNAAIATAETIIANYGAGRTNTAVNAATTALDAAVLDFNSACVAVGGTYTPTADLGLYVGASLSPEPAAGTTLASALAWLKDYAVSHTQYTILLGDDETLPPWTLGSDYYNSNANTAFDGLTGITLTLKGDAAERVIQLDGQGSLFTVYSGVTLILDQNITLRGLSDNNASLVYVYGTLETKAGAKITGNTTSSNGGVDVIGIFTMNGGEISGNTGSGVYVSGTFTMSGGEISGNTGTGVLVISGTFTMNGGKISGNTASTGGGVYVPFGGTFTMNSGEINGNTVSSPVSSHGGGVYVTGTFTMNGGEISGNTTATASIGISYGGGVYVDGSFTMSGGEISGNTVSSSSPSSHGGGVYVNGLFTMNGGEISGNTASSNGGGVYINGTFIMSDNGRVAQDNPIYLSGSTAIITIDSALSGADTVAFIEIPADLAWIGREVIKKSDSFAGTLPTDRFGFTGPWEADSNGRLQPKAVSLGFGETRSAFINRGGIHLYRFTPAFNKRYSITSSIPSSSDYYYDGVYVSAVWADGSGTLADRSYYNYGGGTTPSFVADKTGVDIIIMVDGFPDYSNYRFGLTGVYSVNYNELE
jgi:hypothetical protein